MKNVDSFVDSCYDIANEKIDTNILDLTLKKEITLYHGAYNPNYDMILPKSLNLGNRTHPSQKDSSFWTKDFDYAVMWALDWVLLHFKIPFFHDIKNRKIVMPGYLIASDKESKIRENAYDFIIENIEDFPICVYEATVPTKLVGRGQFPIDEYSIDVPVKPDHVYRITKEITKRVLRWTGKSTFEKYHNAGYGFYQKSKQSLREKIIFKDPRKTLMNRIKILEERREVIPKIKNKS